MQIIKMEKEKIYEEIANYYEKRINENPRIVLGLATGSSPIPLYQKLIEKYQNKDINFSQVKTFNLDEYVGLAKNNEQSYYSFMNDNLFSHVNIDLNNTYIPSANPEHISNYIELLKQNQIDIQLLGIGSNGHIAFNEPGTSKDSTVHKIKLDQGTIQDNSRFFDDINDVPTEAITMGLEDIMNAKEIILIAIGKGKQNIIKELNQCEAYNQNIPATILSEHPNVKIYVDLEAGELI